MLCYSCMHQIPEGSTVCPFCKSSVPYRKEWSEDLAPGTRLQNGRFIIGKALGHGGFGITYIAYDTRLETTRTIKEYFPRSAKRGQNNCPMIRPEDIEEVQRNKEHFLHEARMVTRATRAVNVMKAYDQFDENGTSYIVLEYLDGMTVDDYMTKVLQRPFPWQQAVRYIIQALEGLQSLHDLGLIHRDVSCNNIFLLKNQEIRLIDLGSAETIEDAQYHPDRIWPSKKKSYTPMEQRRGMVQGTASDVYAMCVALYKMITGKAPSDLEGRTLPPIDRFNPRANAPKELDQILEAGTREQMNERIQTAEELALRLKELVGDEDEKPRRKLPLILTICAAAVLLGMGAWLFSRSPEPTPVNIVQQEVDSSWAVPQIAFVDGSAQKTVKRNSVFSLQLRGEPEKLLQLQTEAEDGSVKTMPVVYQLDANGQNTMEIQVSQLDLQAGHSYRMTVGYGGAGRETKAAEPVTLVILDEDVLRPTLSIYGGNTQVGPSQEVTFSGSGEPGEVLMLSARESSSQAWTIGQIRPDGSWSCTRNISELMDRDGQEKLTLEVSYTNENYRELKSSPLALTIQRSIQAVQVDGQVTYLTREIRGSGQAGAQLTLRDEQNRELHAPVFISRDGDFYLSGLDLTGVSQLVFTEQDQSLGVEMTSSFSVWPKPTIGYTEDANESRKNVQVREKEVEVSGTAEPNQRVLILVDEAEETAAADPDGHWSKKLQLGKYAGKVGGMVRRQIRVRYETVEETWADSVLQLNIDNPVFRTPTLHFQGGEETEKSISETGTVQMEGTAESGETLILSLAEDSGWKREIRSDEQGSWHSEEIRAEELLNLERGDLFHFRLAYQSQGDVSAEGELTLSIDRGVDAARVIGILTNQTTEIAGTAEAGANVEILAGEGSGEKVLGQAAVDAAGRFSIGVGSLEGLERIRIRVTDRLGHTAESAAEVWTIPTIAFEAVPDSREHTVRAGEPVNISGTAQPGRTLRIQAGSLISDSVETGDGNWHYTLDTSVLPVGGRGLVLNISVSYQDQANITSEGLSLQVNSNARKTPVLTFAGTEETELTIGGKGEVTLRVEAEPNETLLLTVENTSGLQRSLTMDDQGINELTLSGEKDTDFLLPGLSQYMLQVMYQDQMDLRAERLLTLNVDREARPILLSRSEVRDEDTEIAGTAENGAELTLSAVGGDGNETQIGSAVRAEGESGSFRFEGLNLYGIRALVIRETDAFGNSTEISLQVRESLWKAIRTDEYAAGEVHTYGPANRPQALTGTAEPGKRLKAAWDGRTETIEADADGIWSLSPLPEGLLPEEDGWSGSVTFSYEQEKGDAVTLRFAADYRCETPAVMETEIYADTPEMTLQTEKGSTVTVQGQSYTDEDGDRLIRVPLRDLTENTNIQGYAADAYGNTAEFSVPVVMHRDAVYGYFDSRNLNRTYALGEDVTLRAFIYAGSEVRIVDAGFDILDENENEILSLSSTMSGSGLKTLNVESTVDRKRLPEGFHADIGRQCDLSFPSAGTLLNGRKYQARIWVQTNSGGKTPAGETAYFSYGTDDPWHIGNATDGYFMGLDEPEGGCVFNQNTIWFTGYYYYNPESEEEEASSSSRKRKNTATERVTKVSVELYTDENCTQLAATRDNITIEKKDCLPRNLESALWRDADWEPDTKISGFVIWSSVTKKSDEITQLPDGVYYAKVICTARNPGEFAPLRIELRSGENPGKKSEMIKRVTADWVR